MSSTRMGISLQSSKERTMFKNSSLKTCFISEFTEKACLSSTSMARHTVCFEQKMHSSLVVTRVALAGCPQLLPRSDAS